MVKLQAVSEEGLHAPVKLDIACGQNKQAGYAGIDLGGDADIVHDLFEFPWPIRSNVVREVRCSHFVEHIPFDLPQWEGKDGFLLFFEEVYRICKKGAKLRFEHPYGHSSRAMWDPTHRRFIHEMTYSYINQKWLIENKLDHYGVKCNFEIVGISGTIPDIIQAKNQEFQLFAKDFFINAVYDLQVDLKKLDMDDLR